MSTFDTLNQLALNLTTSDTMKNAIRGLKNFNPIDTLSKHFVTEEANTVETDTVDEIIEELTSEEPEASAQDNAIHRLRGIVLGMFETAQATYRETMASNKEDDQTKEQVNSWFSKVISDASKSSALPLLLSGFASKGNAASLLPLAISLLKTFEQKPEVEEPTDPFKKFQQDIAASAKGFTGALFDLAQNISKGK